MSMLPTLKITGTTPLPHDWHVYLDGIELKGVHSLTLELSTDDIARATIAITPGSIEVDGPVENALRALITEETA